MIKKAFKILFLIAAVFTLLIVVLAVVGSRAAKVSPQEEAEARTAVSEHYARLASIYEALQGSPDDWQATACDGAAMAAELGEAADAELEISGLHFSFLRRFASENAGAWEDDLGEWAWLNTPDASKYKPVDALRPFEARSLAQTWSRPLIDRRYAAVFYPAGEGALNRMPEVAEGGFKGGIFVGWLHLADVVDGEIVCRAPLTVTSSDEVGYRSGGRKLGALLNVSPEEALLKDFQANFETAAREVLPKNATIEL